MKNRLLLSLWLAAGAVLLLLVGFLFGGLFWRGQTGRTSDDLGSRGSDTRPGQVVERLSLSNPPPVPKAVAKPDRVRQNLQEGKTYVTHTKGTLHVRGEDKDWGLREVVTIIYAFEAQIDREIESNDGNTIVELRHFRDVRSLKVDTKLEDVRIELGPAGDLLLAVISFVQPEATPVAAGIIKTLDGASLKKVLDGMRWAGVSPEQIAGLDQGTKVFVAVNRLSGKKVRLTYADGKGIQKIEAVSGVITPQERDFHFATAVLSDALIIPDVDIKIGNRWDAGGSNFINVVDPSLLTRTAGDVTLERFNDHIINGEICRHVQIVAGQIRFEDPEPKVGQTGYFEPRGSLFFSPKDQVIIQGRLTGKGKLERFSKDHLLFETRMRRQPELDIQYTCRMTDTVKGRRP